MEIQRLPGDWKRALSTVVLCCLWALAVPTAARAQKFTSANCYVQSVNMGGNVVWQIKGTATVGNLPAGSTVNVTVTFEKKPNGANNWNTMFTVNQTAPSNNGTANIDTGFQNFTPAPAKGDQYRILVSGTWTTGGPPPQQGKLEPIGSAPITPVP